MRRQVPPRVPAWGARVLAAWRSRLIRVLPAQSVRFSIMTAVVKKLIADDAGQDLAEYGIALAVIGVIAGRVLRSIGKGREQRWISGGSAAPALGAPSHPPHRLRAGAGVPGGAFYSTGCSAHALRSSAHRGAPAAPSRRRRGGGPRSAAPDRSAPRTEFAPQPVAPTPACAGVQVRERTGQTTSTP